MISAEKEKMGWGRTPLVWGLALMAMGGLGWTAWRLSVDVAGGRASHAHLIYCLASPVPVWAEWPASAGVARLGLWTGWGLAVVWAAVVTAASQLYQDRVRVVWLFSALAGAVAAVAGGRAEVAWCMALSVTALAPLSCRPVKVVLTAWVLACGVVAALWGQVRLGLLPVAELGWLPAMSTALLPVIGFIVCSFIRAWRGVAVRCGFVVGFTVVLAGVIYKGTDRSWSEAWSLRGRELIRQLAQGESAQLRRDLIAYRLSEAESSARRRKRPESDTAWAMYPSLVARAPAVVAAWLHSDASVYHPESDVRTQSMRQAELAWVAWRDAHPKSAVADAMLGWSALRRADSGRMGAASQAVNHLGVALRREPQDAALWWGYGKALAWVGRGESAEVALATACTLDGRMLFTPEWDRAPLVGWQSRVQDRIVRWQKEGAWSDQDALEVGRWLAWANAWGAAKGDVLSFLRRPGAPAADHAGEVMRERLVDALTLPNELKTRVIFGAGVVLQTDRYFNNGQSLALFELCRMPGLKSVKSGQVGAVVYRPRLAGWGNVSSYDEGGAGAAPYELEENLLIRLLCYGWHTPRLHMEDRWYKARLEEVR